MKKKLLLSPGPTPVPPQALLAMAQPIIHHRTPEYVEIFNEVRKKLKYLFQTKNEVLTLSSSGTGAMEGAVSNLLSKGDKALVVIGGKFGERWAEICRSYGIEVVLIEVEWGMGVDPNLIAETLEKDPEIKAVYTTMNETSTGVVYDIENIAKIVQKKENCILVVDAISAIGALPCPTDEWGLDVVVAGSQKALMIPPGLAFACLSDKAWNFVEKSSLPKYYFDFKKERKNLLKGQTAYTPAVSLVVAIKETLTMIQEEGLKNIFQRHQRLARATRAEVKAIGLELLAPQSPSNAVTAVKAPEGVDAQEIVKKMKGKYGMIIAGGQAHLKGKIFRIAHLGYADLSDTFSAIACLEMSCKELGLPVTLGAGIRAAQEIFLTD